MTTGTLSRAGATTASRTRAGAGSTSGSQPASTSANQVRRSWPQRRIGGRPSRTTTRTSASGLRVSNGTRILSLNTVVSD